MYNTHQLRLTYLVCHTVRDERPDHHPGRLPSHDAEAQTRSIVDQLDFLHVAPLILQHEMEDTDIHEGPGEQV